MIAYYIIYFILFNNSKSVLRFHRNYQRALFLKIGTYEDSFTLATIQKRVFFLNREKNSPTIVRQWLL